MGLKFKRNEYLHNLKNTLNVFAVEGKSINFLRKSSYIPTNKI